MKTLFKLNLNFIYIFTMIITLVSSTQPLQASESLSNMSESEGDARGVSFTRVTALGTPAPGTLETPSTPHIVLDAEMMAKIGRLETLHRERQSELIQMQSLISAAHEGTLTDPTHLEALASLLTENDAQPTTPEIEIPYSLYNIPAHLEQNAEFTKKLAGAATLQKWAKRLGGLRYFVGFIGGLAVTLINKSFIPKESTPYLEGITTICTYVYGFLEVATQRCAAMARTEEEAAQRHIDEANHQSGRDR